MVTKGIATTSLDHLIVISSWFVDTLKIICLGLFSGLAIAITIANISL